MKILFLPVTSLVLEKKHILVIFRITFQNIDIITDVVIPIAAFLKIVFYHIFCNITKYECKKRDSIRIYAVGWGVFTLWDNIWEHYTLPPSGHDQTKKLRGQIGLNKKFYVQEA